MGEGWSALGAQAGATVSQGTWEVFWSSPSLTTQEKSEAQEECELPVPTQQLKGELVLEFGSPPSFRPETQLPQPTSLCQPTHQGRGHTQMFPSAQTKPGPDREPMCPSGGASGLLAPPDTIFPYRVLPTHPWPPTTPTFNYQREVS